MQAMLSVLLHGCIGFEQNTSQNQFADKLVWATRIASLLCQLSTYLLLTVHSAMQIAISTLLGLSAIACLAM